MYKVALNTSKPKYTSFQELINHFIYLGKGKFNVEHYHNYNVFVYLWLQNREITI